jgi:hypothetical protein
MKKALWEQRKNNARNILYYFFLTLNNFARGREQQASKAMVTLAKEIGIFAESFNMN